MKNTFDGIIVKLNKAEERISELEFNINRILKN